MTRQERIFHAVSFELIALAMVLPLATLAIGKQPHSIAAVGIGFSLFTVVWNYIYNLYFDRWFGSNRNERSMIVRVVHSVGFEGGLVFITVPVTAWFLEISLWQAVALELGFLIFFFFYTTGFNWVYDKIQPYQRLCGQYYKLRKYEIE